jgi:hypothetical protein
MSEARVTLQQVEDAVDLVEFALRRRTSAEADDEFRRLRDDYRDQPRFADLVNTVVDRLGLRVVGESRFGLVLAPLEGSVFAARTGDYREGLAVEDRVLHGLAHLGIAAYCYPTANTLADSRVVSIDPVKVSGEITDAAQQLEADAPDEVAVDSEELREAWRAWLALPPNLSGKRGERRGSRLWYVHQALRWLTEQQLLSYDGTVWRTTHAYQAHVADIASDVKFLLVRACTGEDPDRHAAPPDADGPVDDDHLEDAR